MKKFLLLAIPLLLTGCQPNSPKNIDHQSDFNFLTTLQTGDFVNDFSQLDRSLITWPLNYKECVEKNGSGAIETNTHYNSQTCKDEKESYTFYDRKDYDTLHLKPENNHYNLDHNINALLAWIFTDIHLPVQEQNSLIELFAQTGEELDSNQPQTIHPNRNRSRTGRFSYPQISTSGYFSKDFEVKWTKNWLHIQKTSQRKHEPNLSLILPNKEKIEVGSLVNPDAIIIREGEDHNTPLPTTTQIINTALKNQIWTNIKLTLATLTYDDESEEYKQETHLEITINKLSYEDFNLDPNLCFENECFDPNLPIYNYKNRYSQSRENPAEEASTTLLYNPHLKLFLKQENLFMQSRLSRKTKNTDHQRSGLLESTCGPSSLTQNILTGENTLQVPQTLTIYWETYTLQPLNKNIIYGVDAQTDKKFTQKFSQLFADAAEAEAYITQQIQDQLLIYGNYILSFMQYPNLYLTYSNLNFLENPQAIYYSETPLTLNNSWELENIQQTIDLYCDLRLDSDDNTLCQQNTQKGARTFEGMVFFDEWKEEKIEGNWNFRPNPRYSKRTFFEQASPIFRLKKSKNQNYYFVYPADGVSFSNGGYGCKPVIYTYDQLERENQVTITLPPYASFTTLIPQFTTGTTRTFSTNKSSQIQVEQQTYPYLYYSTLRKTYQNNTYGRTVAYEDIEFFLNAKLEAMNFNQQEKSDFLEYWLPEFQPGFVYSISFKFNEEFAPYAELNFKHEPEKSFRVFMEAHQSPRTTHISFDRNYPNAGNDNYLQRFERGSTFDMLERGGNLEKLEP